MDFFNKVASDDSIKFFKKLKELGHIDNCGYITEKNIYNEFDKNKIVFLKIAWMNEYDGIKENDKPANGGEFVNRNEEAGECFNFRNVNNIAYGYVNRYKKGKEQKSNINRICENNNGLFLENILAVFVATPPHPKNGSYIVGWYKHATFYKEAVYNSIKERECLPYSVTTSFNNAVLLPVDERFNFFKIPTTREENKKYGSVMKKTQIWYANEKVKNEVLEKIIKYKMEVIL